MSSLIGCSNKLKEKELGKFSKSTFLEDFDGQVVIDEVGNETGLVSIYTTFEGNWIYDGEFSKKGKEVLYVRGYIVDRNRSQALYNKTCMHELGHALGWLGHSSNSNDVMYHTESTVSTLTYRDERHLTQVYN